MITNIQLNLSHYTNKQDEGSILFKCIEIKQGRGFRFLLGKQMRKEQTEVCRQMTVLPSTTLVPNIDWIVYMGSAGQSYSPISSKSSKSPFFVLSMDSSSTLILIIN